MGVVKTMGIGWTEVLQDEPDEIVERMMELCDEHGFEGVHHGVIASFIPTTKREIGTKRDSLFDLLHKEIQPSATLSSSDNLSFPILRMHHSLSSFKNA